MAKGKATMQQIADELGISKVSVSKALNNQNGISESLRSKIIDKADELGYIKTKDTGIEFKKFLFVIPKRYFLSTDNYYTIIYYHLNRNIQKAKMEIVNYVINNEEEESLTLPDSLNTKDFDGIFVGGEFTKGYLDVLADVKLPIVTIDFCSPEFDFDCTVVDNFYLGYQAAKYLIKNGHKTIGFVGDINQTNSIADRYYGYVKAIEKFNLPLNKDWVFSNNDSLMGTYFLSFSLPEIIPSAFVCHCDMAAYYLMQKLEGIGLSVPDDVSIISFDNTELTEKTNPKLTTIDINKKEFADKAFGQMISRLKNNDLLPQRSYIHTKMVIRDSVKKVACDG